MQTQRHLPRTSHTYKWKDHDEHIYILKNPHPRTIVEQYPGKQGSEIYKLLIPIHSVSLIDHHQVSQTLELTVWKSKLPQVENNESKRDRTEEAAAAAAVASSLVAVPAAAASYHHRPMNSEPKHVPQLPDSIANLLVVGKPPAQERMVRVVSPVPVAKDLHHCLAAEGKPNPLRRRPCAGDLTVGVSHCRWLAREVGGWGFQVWQRSGSFSISERENSLFVALNKYI